MKEKGRLGSVFRRLEVGEGVILKHITMGVMLCPRWAGLRQHYGLGGIFFVLFCFDFWHQSSSIAFSCSWSSTSVPLCSFSTLSLTLTLTASNLYCSSLFSPFHHLKYYMAQGHFYGHPSLGGDPTRTPWHPGLTTSRHLLLYFEIACFLVHEHSANSYVSCMQGQCLLHHHNSGASTHWHSINIVIEWVKNSCEMRWDMERGAVVYTMLSQTPSPLEHKGLK